MTSKKQIILAFDAYGTLLSTESISKDLAEHFGEEKAATISQQWRRYQLEYTWRLNSMESYEPFSTLTRKSLNHALAEAGLSLDDTQTDKLMKQYDNLSLFPDVPPIFTHLANAPHIHPVIFSNGTHSMISTTLSQSPAISPHAHLFKKLVVVDDMPTPTPTTINMKKAYKPHPSAYDHLIESAGSLKSDKEGGWVRDVWLVSGNPFDIVGARNYGLSACWVDRSGQGWVDELGGEQLRPDVIVEGLHQVVGRIEEVMSMREREGKT